MCSDDPPQGSSPWQRQGAGWPRGEVLKSLGEYGYVAGISMNLGILQGVSAPPLFSHLELLAT